MSFFTRIVSNVKEFYSEINQATLTGAIDVIVVKQDDGTFKSSPFHVRFGKLGVLKAKEKIVDLEINGEPVELQMKLDDTGAAFFVHQLDDNQEDDVDSPDLATSPIPEQKTRWRERKSGTFQPISLFPNIEGSSGTPGVDPIHHVVLQSNEHAESSPEARNLDSTSKADFLRKQTTKSYLKKRRRKRQQRGHSRGGSKSSLKEIMMNSDNDMFLMDDVNDADQENDEHEDEDEKSFSSPEVKLSIEFANAFELSSSSCHGELNRTDSINTDEVTVENSLIGSRVPLIPKSSSEAEALAALLVVDSDVDVDMETVEQFRPKSVAADFHYFSDGDVDTIMSLSSTPNCVVSDSEFENSQRREEDQNVWRWGELPNRSHDSGVDNGEKNIKEELEEAGGSNGEKEKTSWFSVWGTPKNPENKNEEIKNEDPPGIYLDDLMADPDKLAYYLNPISSLPEVPVKDEEDPLGDINRAVYNDEDLESGNGHSLPVSPASGVRVAPEGVRHASSNYESDTELQDLPSLISKHLPDLAASLCGGLNDSSITLESFEANMLTYSEFLEKMKTSKDFLTSDPNLVIRVHDKYMSWSSAAPILLSVMLYRQPLPTDLIQEIRKDGIDVNVTLSPEEIKNNRVGAKKSSTWFGWLSGTKSNEEIKQESGESEAVTDKAPVDNSCQAGEGTSETDNFKIEIEEETERNSIIIEEDEIGKGGKKRFRKTLRLSSEQLAELNLRSGSNEIQFSVTTAFQGTSRCMCHIYLWDHTDKVVISDIDGTITKSDVLGHILPVIGRDWAQSGVARLFSKIRNNGYHMIYLSARAIGQASITKDYLQSVKQGEVSLPDGPMFLNPDSLIHAFRREVIDRNPEEFKIRCLKDIYSLFEGKNPFFAGYGNRPNDAFAYAAVGIPVSRIFTVNPAGELKHELKLNFQTSYVEQDKMVDQVFPPIGLGFDPDFKIEEFASFGFWREAPLEIDLEDVEGMLEASS